MWPSAWLPLQVGELERVGEHLGQADVLVDLDHLSRAHHAEIGTRRAHPRLGLGGLPGDDEDGVARADGVDLAADRRRDRAPVLHRERRVERQLRQPLRDRVAVDGDAGAVRPTVAHLGEHRHEVHAETLLDLGSLREQSDDPAHSCLLPSTRIIHRCSAA